MTVVVRLGSINFNDGVDGNGTQWVCDDLAGWYDGPVMRQSALTMTGQWGSLLTENQYGSRHMVLSGSAIPGPGVSPSAIANKINNVTDVTSGWKTLYVDEPTPKQCEVKRDGELRFQARPTVCKFQVPLIAPDPRKYGQVLREEEILVNAGGSDQSTTMTITNIGNTQAYPEEIRVWGTGSPLIRVIRVDTDEQIRLQTAPVGTANYFLYPNPISENGRRVLYGEPTVPGESDGLDSHYEYVASDTQWFKLKADGVGTQIRLTRSDTPANNLHARIRFRDAWI